MRATMARAWRYGTAHPFLVDTVLPCLGLVGIVLAARYNYASTGRTFDRAGILLTALATLPVIVRRRAPLTVLLVCLAGSAASVVAGYWDALNNFGPLVAVYTVAVYRSRPVAAVAAALTAAVLATEGITTSAGPAWLFIILGLLFSASAWALGGTRRMLTDRNTQLAELTRQLERDREARARQAVTEERLRIARELHDVLAHHMSVIAVQAGLARYVLESDPPTASGALRAIGDTSSEALAEMRRLLSLLRLGPDPSAAPEDLAPAFGLDRIGELVDRVRATGVQVGLTIRGEPRDLPPSAGRCVYRVVQESLTNVVKHAGHATATVTLDYGAPDAVTFTARITDTGRGGTVSPDTPGHGLIGMRERAKLNGGTVTAAARPGGGFEVVLLLPIVR